MSFDIASSIFRKFSAWRSFAEVNSIFAIFVRPSTSEATSSPNRRSELAGGGEGVLHGVVEQARRDRHLVEAHVREDAGHLDRMDQIGLMREPLLALVDLGREDVGALQEREVARRVGSRAPCRRRR